MKLKTVAALLLALTSPACFASMIFSAAMTGANEVPSVNTTATGFTTVTIDGDSMTVDVEWADLTGGNAAAGHIHCCVDPGGNVGVAVGFPGLPAATSGTYNRTFDLLDSSIYTASFLTNFGGGTAAGAQSALITGLLSGRAYSNLHNARFPGGEIRGLLVEAPEPGTLALLGLGLFGLAASRRRQSV